MYPTSATSSGTSGAGGRPAIGAGPGQVRPRVSLRVDADAGRGTRTPPPLRVSVADLTNLRPRVQGCQPRTGSVSGDGIAGSCSRSSHQAIPLSPRNRPGLVPPAAPQGQSPARSAVALDRRHAQRHRLRSSLHQRGVPAQQRIGGACRAMAEREIVALVELRPDAAPGASPRGRAPPRPGRSPTRAPRPRAAASARCPLRRGTTSRPPCSGSAATRLVAIRRHADRPRSPSARRTMTARTRRRPRRPSRKRSSPVATKSSSSAQPIPAEPCESPHR